MKTALIISFCFSSIGVFGQCLIKGIVKDEHNDPLQAVTVALLKKKDTAAINIVQTDTKGIYIFKNVPAGFYVIKATAPGRKPVTAIPFEVVEKIDSTIIPDIFLIAEVKTLNEVTVTSKKQLVEIDKGKIVFNVQNDATTSGLTAFDVLKKLPAVTVDQNENIILNGSTGVNILVDGKMTYLSGTQLTNFLKSISAEDINKIELNLAPSAEYDASGNAGIINIVPKRNLQKGYAVDIRTGITKGYYWMPNENVSASYRAKNISFYGSFDYKTPYNHWNSKSGNTIYSNGQNIELKRENPASVKANYYTRRAGIDWQFLRNHRVSADYLGYLDNWENTTYSTIKNYNENNDFLSSVNSINALTEPYYYDGVNLNYRFDIDSAGKKITAEAHYISYRNYSDGLMTTNNYDANGSFIQGNLLRSHQPGFITIKSVKADAELPFTRFFIKTGLKYAEVANDNMYRFDSLQGSNYVEIDDMSNHFKYKERIAAAYISVSKKTKKTSIDAGLRLEYTKADGYTIKQAVNNHWEYANLFPTLSLEQQTNEMDKFNFSVSRRINRPSYGDLNPVRWYNDPYFYYAGNPNLVPETAWILSTAYALKRKYIFTATYGITNNYMNRKLSIDTNGYSVRSQPANLGRLRRFDFIASVPLRIFSFWEMQLMPSISYMSYPISQLNGEKTLSKWFATFSVQQQLKLPAEIRMNIFTRGSSAALRGIYETHSWFYTDVGFRKSFGRNKFDMQLTFSDIFNTSRYQGVSKSNVTDYHYKDEPDTRRIGIALHYHFGSDTFKENSKKTEEQERL